MIALRGKRAGTKILLEMKGKGRKRDRFLLTDEAMTKKGALHSRAAIPLRAQGRKK